MAGTIIIPMKYTEEFLEEHQDKKRAELFVKIPIPEEYKNIPVYSKLESQNIMRSDRITPTDCKTWFEQFTGMPPIAIAASQRSPEYQAKVRVKDDDGTERNVGVDDGFIWTYQGRFHGIAYFTRDNRRVTKEEADSMVEQGMSRPPQRYHEWYFYLHELILTDGPGRRERLMETFEQQRSRSETNMATAIAKAFDRMQPQKTLPDTPIDLMTQIREQMKEGGIAPEQLLAMAEEADEGLKRKK